MRVCGRERGERVRGSGEKEQEKESEMERVRESDGGSERGRE